MGHPKAFFGIEARPPAKKHPFEKPNDVSILRVLTEGEPAMDIR
jgi:hypothetical protein